MQEILEAPLLGVVKFNVTDAEIARMKDEYMGLTVNGIEDKAGLKKVYESRQLVKKTRTALVKHADQMKADAITWQRKVNDEKNRVVGELETIEAHLQGEEDKIEAIKEKMRREEEEKERVRIQTRIDKLAAFGFQIDYVTITAIDDATFDKVLADAEAGFKRELETKAEAERKAQEEAARLKAEREELEKLRAERAEAQRIIDDNNARIAREHAEKEAELKRREYEAQRAKEEAEAKIRQSEQERLHAERVAKAREEAAEAARLQAIEDARIAAELKEREEKQAKIEAERQASLRPDKEKLGEFIETLIALKVPDVSDPAAKEIVNEIRTMIHKMHVHIYKKIKTL